MKLTYGNQTIDLFPNGVPEICPISISGGLDSASLLFLVSKHFPQIKLIPYVCRDQMAPKDADAAEQIVEWMQMRFPENNIPDIEIYEFNAHNEEFVTYDKVEEWRSKWPQFKTMSRAGISKVIQVDTISWNIMKRFPGAVRLDGMTRNPPSNHMRVFGFYDKAERRRDKEVAPVEVYRIYDRAFLNIHQPYANVDKKFVADVYATNGLMETLYPLTRSCIGTYKQTDGFTRECYKCFWCHEKAWAFNYKLPSNLSKNIIKGGPGDRSAPGKVNTEAWWNTLDGEGLDKALKDNSIVQQAKSKDIYFCTIPFTQIYSELDGQYQACCFGGSSGINVEEVPLKQWMEKSDYMNDLRREMTTVGSDLKAVDKWCKRCRSDEDRYGRSRRTNCMKIHTNDAKFWNKIENQVTKFRETGEFNLKGAGRIFEVQLKIYGSECNLDCYMCHHDNSTTRMQVADKGVWSNIIFGDRSPERALHSQKVMKDKTAGITEQIVEIAQYVRSIKIIGGEPLIMKKHYEMLDKLIEIGESRRIRIKYQTNLTQTKSGKHNIFNYIPHFDRVTVVASVDGIGAPIEYMRRRTKWDEVVKNIDICSKYDNVVIDFNGLVSFLSVLRFYEVIDWCKERPIINQLNWAFVERPPHLDPRNLPKKLKDQLIPKYQDWPDIIAALKMEPDPRVDIQDVFDYLLKADDFYKGTKWEMHLFEVFPELKEYYIPREPSPHQEELFKEWDAAAKKIQDIDSTDIV